MTRTGKIARLPVRVREQLNRRLQDGESGPRLVEWLNALPEVQTVLAAEFGGRAISEQNLSEWRQGGYRDWEQHDEACAMVRELTRRTDELTEQAEGLEVSQRLATVLSVELARVAETLLAQTTDPQERWQRLQQLLGEVAQLRQEDRKAGWLALERERREEESNERLEAERRNVFKREKDKILAPFWAKVQLGALAEAFGGGDAGRDVAAFILEVQRDLPLGSLTGKLGSHQVKPDQTESNQIKPDERTHGQT